MRSATIIFLCFYNFIQFSDGDPCNPSKIQCLSWNTYKLCVETSGNGQLVGNTVTCQTGTVCDDQGSFPCVKGSPPATTTTPIPVTAPPCKGPNKYKATLCSQYYECVSTLWWWQPKLQDCPEGQVFNEKFRDCEDPGPLNCGAPPTTPKPTTTPVPITAPPCKAKSKFQATNCADYYECIPQLWWFEPTLKTCPTGTVFNPSISDCEDPSPDNCGGNTATPAPTTTTTLIPVVSDPACFKSVNISATFCNQYYECQPYYWWWVPHLKTCPMLQGFDEETKTCQSAEQLKCFIATTTTTSTTTTPVPTTTEAPVTAPACPGPGNHSARECNQYYQCVSNLWWYQPQLKTCPEGQGFDEGTSRCVLAKCDVATTNKQTTETITTISTMTTAGNVVTAPPCPRRGNHSAGLCNQYYECVSVWWWFEPRLKTCPSGFGFDAESSSCQDAGTVGCSIATTRTTPTTIATKSSEDITTTVKPTTTTPKATTTTTVKAQTTTTVKAQTTTTSTPVTEPVIIIPAPACGNKPSQHPATNCNQYWACEQDWWWYSPTLKTCPSGLGFDAESSSCQDAATVGCSS